MSYELYFHPDALREWRKLPGNIQYQLKKTLQRRLHNPHIISAQLKGHLKDCYKIKLRNDGYRLVYQVNENDLTLFVVAVGKRDNSNAYQKAQKRLKD